MNDFEKYMLSCSEVPYLVICGTGLAAKFVYEGLMKMGIKINCFVEGGNETKRTYLGLPVNSENDIPNNSRCLICANPDYKIEKRLERCGITDWKYIDPIICREYAHNNDYFKTIIRRLTDNKKRIDDLRECLADEQSRHVLDVVLEHRINPEIRKIYEIFTEQYFGNDLVKRVDGYDFVDCGAYNGDTLKRFIHQLENPIEYFKNHVYHAFEADRSNINQIVEYCNKKKIENVIVHQAVVWNGEEEEIFFEVDDSEISVGGKASDDKTERAIKVKAESLDIALAGQNVDMIIMDIEGAEPEALKGAKNIIKEKAPILAISVYHELNHIWEIPLQIKALNSDYKIYLRHHRWNMADTVCYAISSQS